MARKMVLEVKMEITVNVDDDVVLDELELEVDSTNTAVDVLDCETKTVGVLDSK